MKIFGKKIFGIDLRTAEDKVVGENARLRIEAIAADNEQLKEQLKESKKIVADIKERERVDEATKLKNEAIRKEAMKTHDAAKARARQARDKVIVKHLEIIERELATIEGNVLTPLRKAQINLVVEKSKAVLASYDFKVPTEISEISTLLNQYGG